MKVWIQSTLLAKYWSRHRAVNTAGAFHSREQMGGYLQTVGR